MTITIDTPSDASTGQPTIVTALGTATNADFVQVRLERPDGAVWDGSSWVIDEVTARHTSGSSINSTIDMSSHGRITGEYAKFAVEWVGSFDDVNTTTSDSEYFFNVRHLLLSYFYAGSPKPIAVGVDDTNTSNYFTPSLNLAQIEPSLEDHDLFELRYEFDKANEIANMYFRFYGETEWRIFESNVDMSAAGPLGGTSFDQSEVEIFVSNYFTTPTTASLTQGTSKAIRMYDHAGQKIFDLDLTRDAVPGQTDPFVDPDGNVWQISGSTMSLDRRRDDQWFTAFGVGNWSWESPTLAAGDYEISVREVSGGVGGDVSTVSFSTGTLDLVDEKKDRFIRRGTGIYLWAPVISDPSNPTHLELRQATEITCDVADFSGLSLNHEVVDLAHINSVQDKGMVGTIAAQSPTLSMYDNDEDTSLYRELFPAGATGFLILAPYGVTDAGDRVTVIPCESAGNSDVWTVANQPARYVVSFAVTGDIHETVVDYS